MTRFSIALVPIALIVILAGGHGSAHAQSMGGGGSVGYAACDGIITQPVIYYDTANWTNSPSNSGFSYDDNASYIVSCATSYGNTSVSMSASMSNCFENAGTTGESNTFAVNVKAGGAVGAATSLYNATSTVKYGGPDYAVTTATGSAPYGASLTSYSDTEYSVITTTIIPPGELVTCNGTATGSAYAPASP